MVPAEVVLELGQVREPQLAPRALVDRFDRHAMIVARCGASQKGPSALPAPLVVPLVGQPRGCTNRLVDRITIVGGTRG